jgi:hypothetical protein|tara:strand:+ start:166 stop:609 length:444 start_codon:yes stop_codon:yes gene_type:complete
MEKSKHNIITTAKIILEDTTLERKTTNINKCIISDENEYKTVLKSTELTTPELELKTTVKKQKFKNLTKLKNHIDTLSKNEYIEIYKIININNEKYSQNKNGIMFDIMKFKEDTIEKIINFITYIETNNLLVDTDEQQRNSYRTLLT